MKLISLRRKKPPVCYCDGDKRKVHDSRRAENMGLPPAGKYETVTFCRCSNSKRLIVLSFDEVCMRDWIPETTKDISAIGDIEDEHDAEIGSDVRPGSCVI